MQLPGRTAVVTGASRGLGLATARALTAAGARVVLVARDSARLEQVAADTGGIALPADLADPEQVAGLWRRAEDVAGPVHLLVNNAGSAAAAGFDGTDWADVERAVRVNLLTPMRLCRDAAIAMTRHGSGHLVNVSSLAGAATVPGLAAYGATKAGLSHFTGCLRVELADRPIGITLVELGPVPTDMLSDVKRHAPTRAAFRRLAALRMLVDVPATRVAEAIVDAVQHDRGHVRLPRRAAALSLLAEAPRRATALTLVGVPRR